MKKQAKSCTYIVIFGNIIDGLSIYGPFPSMIKAVEYAEEDGGEWVISALELP